MQAHRAVRGGSWINNARNVRSAYRNANPRDDRNNNLGFRLALSCSAVWPRWMPGPRCWTRCCIRRGHLRMNAVGSRQTARHPGCW